LLLALVAAGRSPAAEDNALLDDLLAPGVAIGNSQHRLPTPTLADGLSSEEQRQALASITDNNHPLDALVRKAVVAPFVLRIKDEPNVGPGRPRRVDVWFVAHGDFDRLSDEEFLKEQVDTETKSGAAGSLTDGVMLKEDQIRARKIELVPDEQFLAIHLEMFDRVNVRGTMRARLSRGTESVTLAATLDPRFSQDREFPNAWRPQRLDDAGHVVTGAARPCAGAAWYCKATKLKQPAGAILIEYPGPASPGQSWRDLVAGPTEATWRPISRCPRSSGRQPGLKWP
jgi:hypothetical protein